MKILVIGATGATGKHAVHQLLKKGEQVKIIARSENSVPDSWKNNESVTILYGSILEIEETVIFEFISDCHAIISCLGHTLSWKGVYGQPRLLVTESVELMCKLSSAHTPENPMKFVLMNTTGNRNRDVLEPISFAQKCVIGLLRLLLPPHVDNEKAADYLRTEIGKDNKLIEWVVVRPDNLINDDEVSAYETYPSPIRSAIFDSGKTSRINVGNFMAELVSDIELWTKWKGQMPVIYNQDSNDS